MTRKLEDGEALYAALKTGGAPPLTRWALWSEIDPDTRARYAAAERAIRDGALNDAAKICEEQAGWFMSPSYATDQPLSSFHERFACAQCASSIRRARAAVSEGE